MAKTATIHARLDETIKEDALKVFDQLGLSVAEAITIYFKQVAIKNSIPFELNLKPSIAKNNFDKISEFKKQNVQNILDMIPDSVDELWIFGSAVTAYCKPTSDLDVCVIGDNISHEDLKRIFAAPKCAIDLLNATHEEFNSFRQEPGNIFAEVYNKGLMIYKKGVGLVNE